MGGWAWECHVVEKSLRNIRHPEEFVYLSRVSAPMISRLFLIFTILAAPLFAETRAWKSADGVRSVQGEFIKRDAASVTIRNSSGKEVTIEFTKLHADELEWLNVNHPLKKAPAAKPAPAPNPAPNPAAIFDTLTFEDTRATVETKLKASKVVKAAVDETFIGRTGLNGIYQTRQKIGGLNCLLYFDWTEAGKLKEITLQTELHPVSDYKAVIEPSWNGFIELLNTLYGNPVQQGPLPSPQSVADGSFAPSHLWTLESGGSAMLGTARDGDKYQLVVRFTQTKVQPVEIP